MKLSSIIFEGFKEHVSIINGEKYSADFIGEADTLDDFNKAVDRIPDTIQSIKVPTNTNVFMTSDKDDEMFFPQGNWKQDIKTTVARVVGEHEKKGNKLESIRISSYYPIGPKGANDHPIYVSIDTKESREFGAAMSRGDYGPLD